MENIEPASVIAFILPLALGAIRAFLSKDKGHLTEAEAATIALLEAVVTYLEVIAK